jgi:hypothetical protein
MMARTLRGYTLLLNGGAPGATLERVLSDRSA